MSAAPVSAEQIAPAATSFQDVPFLVPLCRAISDEPPLLSLSSGPTGRLRKVLLGDAFAAITAAPPLREEI